MLKWKKRRKKSLRLRLFLLINIVILMVISICILLNTVVFQKYYISQKTDILKDNMDDIETHLNNEAMTDELFRLKMERLCVNSNISLFIFDKDDILIYSSVPENAFRFQRPHDIQIHREGNDIFIQSNLLNLSGRNSDREIIEQGQNYVLTSSTISSLNTRVMELYALTDGDYFVCIQSSIAPIQESVSFANRFLLIIGLIVWFIAAIISTFLGYRLVKPLKQLSDISQRMAKMDFGQKYTGQTDDEVGKLGESINMMSDNLERAISELKAANAKLLSDINKKEKIDKQRKDFLSNVSHELKTPIAIIEAYAEGLCEMELDEEGRKYYCDVILDETKKMNLLIRKLMNLMQIETGSDRLDVSRFDITEQIRDIIKQKSILLEQNGVSAEFDEKEAIYVWADDFLIEEVILNYLTNAIKYCSGEKKIKISIEKIADNVRINVFNTGEALDEETMENMWKSFYMADKARTRDNGSQGLGLSIVAAIINAHNHSYGAYNTDGGVVFYFELDGKSE